MVRRPSRTALHMMRLCTSTENVTHSLVAGDAVIAGALLHMNRSCTPGSGPPTCDGTAPAAKLVPSGNAGFVLSSGGSSPQLGVSVAISYDSLTIVAGANGDSNNVGLLLFLTELAFAIRARLPPLLV